MHSSAPRLTGQLQSRPATRIPTVCVVDPKSDDYQGWDSLAEAEGAKLQFVVTAEEALRLARTTAVNLWVVNTDLPRLSGFELCSILRTQSPPTPVYLVAKQYSSALERAAWSAKATLFGCKPAHREWLDKWLQLQSRQCELTQ